MKKILKAFTVMVIMIIMIIAVLCEAFGFSMMAEGKIFGLLLSVLPLMFILFVYIYLITEEEIK